MEDRKILVEVTKEELELLQNGFYKEPQEKDEQPANLIQRLLNKLYIIQPTKEDKCNSINMMGEAEPMTIATYEYSNCEIRVIQKERCKPKIEIVCK